MENYFEMKLTPAQVNQISNLGLALVGDGVYELMVRTYLCAQGDHTVLHLHQDTVRQMHAVKVPQTDHACVGKFDLLHGF